MPFSWNKFPYTNFHELNLDWFINKFKEIFEEWSELYNELLAWKEETDASLSDWKTNAENDISDWKTSAENDISDWETGVLSDLNDWQDSFETLFDTTFSNLTDIKTDAEAARDRAETAATSAEEDASEISSSLAAITKNTNDITTLASAFNSIFVRGSWIPSITKNSYCDSTGTHASGSGKYARTTYVNPAYPTKIAFEFTNNDFEYNIIYYNESGNISTGSGYTGASGYKQGLTYFPVICNIFAVNFKKLDNTAIVDEDVETIKNSIYIYSTTDSSLSESGKFASAKTMGTKINDLMYNFINYNSYDYLPTFATYTDRTSNGVTYTFSEDKRSCAVNGTATALSFTNFYNNSSELPNGIYPENTYYIKFTKSGSGVSLTFQFYFSGVAGDTIFFNNDDILTIPNGATGLLMRLRVGSGTVVNNVTVKFAMLTACANKDLYNNVNEIESKYSGIPVINENSQKISPAVTASLLKWTPLANCSVDHSKNVSYIGIPYNANRHHTGKDVFINRNLSTFASAVKNPTSIMYTEADLTGDCVYGAMCSSFSGWLVGNERVRITQELYESCIEKYTYRGTTSLEIGDVLIIWNGSSGHSMVICGMELNATTGRIEFINVVEEVHPNLTYHKYSVAEFESLLSRYEIGKYKDFKVIDSVNPIRYATDIIADYGNNTWYKNGDKVWVYMPNNPSNIYITDLDSDNTVTIAVSSLTSKTVTVDSINYTVYDISYYLSQNHEYEITTNTSLPDKAYILIVDTGTFTFNSSNKTVTITDSSINSEWGYIYGYSSVDGSGTRIYPNGDDVIEIENNVFDLSAFYTNGTPLYPYFKIEVFYPTKYGQAVASSSIISAT